MILGLTARDGELSPVEVGYAKVLVQLIQSYESALVGNFFDGVTGSDVLEYLLNEHQMTQTDAAYIAGVSKQNLNDFLKGRRGLPKDARLGLAKHFKLDAHVFADECSLATLTFRIVETVSGPVHPFSIARVEPSAR